MIDAPGGYPAGVLRAPRVLDGRQDELGAISFSLVLLATLLQKFATPGTAGLVPLSLPLLYGLMLWGVARNLLVVREDMLSMFSIVAVVFSTCYFLAESPAKSAPSLCLFLAIHLPYVFRFNPELGFGSDVAARQFCNVMAFFGLLGTAQFASQFVVGANIAFYLDGPAGENIRIAGYNVLNSLYFGSELYKSNGFFFLEASTFNQCLCLAVVLEVIYFANVLRLLIYASAILLTFSGTGLLMLALILPVAAVRARQTRFLLVAAAFLTLVFVFGDRLGLSFFVNRVDEFSNPNSSGFARFISPFIYLRDHVFEDLRTMLFGRGAGTSTEFLLQYSFATFNPSWAKTLYEEGLIGSIVYWFFIGALMFRRVDSRIVAAAILFEFVFLGGYTLIPALHLQIIALLAWPSAADGGRLLDAHGSRSRPRLLRERC